VAVAFVPPASFEYEERGAIATITLNRPERLNALTFEVYSELADLFAALNARPHIRCVVITGKGRGFCSGGDVKDIIGQLVGRSMEDLVAFTRMTGALIQRIRECTKPVVAAINGVAAGAGAVIALACDFRIASDAASLAFLFTRVGLAGADMGSAYLLPRIVGLARATELLFLGDTIGAAEAERLGLFTRVVPPEALAREANALAERIAQGPSFALGVTKRLLNTELDVDFAAAIEAEAHGQALCMQARNFREFHEAFTAKRRPEFD
jgi:enoyl-CoA hydratase/carnithine racemase